MLPCSSYADPERQGRQERTLEAVMHAGVLALSVHLLAALLHTPCRLPLVAVFTLGGYFFFFFLIWFYLLDGML